jgi:galactoside O-acetyltransferase
MYDMSQFASVGEDVILYPHIVFIQPENIHLGSRTVVSEFCHIYGGRGVVIGNFVHISPFSSIAGSGALIIEDFSGLSAGARVVTGTALFDGEGLVNHTVPRELGAVSRSYVHIGKHVNIGTNAIIHPGVTIGEGAIIGSNSLVTKDVEPWTVCVGSPCKAVRSRPKKRIKELEKLAYEKANIEPLDISGFLYLKYTTDTIPPKEVV